MFTDAGFGRSGSRYRTASVGVIAGDRQGAPGGLLLLAGMEADDAFAGAGP
jgi:hypothetical protein